MSLNTSSERIGVRQKSCRYTCKTDLSFNVYLHFYSYLARNLVILVHWKIYNSFSDVIFRHIHLHLDWHCTCVIVKPCPQSISPKAGGGVPQKQDQVVVNRCDSQFKFASFSQHPKHPKVPKKKPKESKSTQKHPIVPKVSQKHTKVPTQKHPTVSKSTQK